MQNSRQYTFIQNYRHTKAENINLNKYYIWDTLEIDWKEVTVTFNENKINMPGVVTIKLQDKISQISDEQRTFTLSPNAETRNFVVYFGCRHVRDCMNRHYKI